MAHLKGPWRVEFIDGGPTLPKAYNCHALRSWTDNGDEQAQYFTGTARYTIRFDRPPGTGPWVLNLGEVHESARVRLNGVGISTLIQAPFQVVLTDLAPVGNMLEVEVTNLSANRIRYMDRQHIPWRVFNDINFVSITYHPFNAAQWPVHPSGLLGPVTIHAGRQSL